MKGFGVRKGRRSQWSRREGWRRKGRTRNLLRGWRIRGSMCEDEGPHLCFQLPAVFLLALLVSKLARRRTDLSSPYFIFKLVNELTQRSVYEVLCESTRLITLIIISTKTPLTRSWMNYILYLVNDKQQDVSKIHNFNQIWTHKNTVRASYFGWK